MSIMDKDTIEPLLKRAYDMAGLMANKGGKRLTFYLDGNKIPVKDIVSSIIGRSNWAIPNPPRSHPQPSHHFNIMMISHLTVVFSITSSLCTCFGSVIKE
jgi:hypothetical protein